MQTKLKNVTLDDIREKLTSNLLGLCLIFALASLVGSLLRISSVGFLPVMALHIFISVLFAIVFALENRIPRVFRAIFICSSFFIAGAAGVHNFGLSAGGIILLFACSIASSLILNIRVAIAYMCGSVGILTIYAFLVSYGDFRFVVDQGNYSSQASSWFVYIITFTFINSIILFLIHTVFTFLISMIARQQKHLSKQGDELAYSQTVLNTVLNNLPFQILWKNTERIYIGANSLFLKHANLADASHLKGKVDKDFMPLEDAEKIGKMEMSLLKGEKDKIRYEDTFYGPQGQEKYREIKRVAMYSESGSLAGVLVSFHDITDYKLLQQQTQKAMLEAETANQAKSRFLAKITHEIRTPINGVLGLLDLTLRTDLNATQKDYLQKVVTSTKRLTNIINDVLDLSKIEANQLHLEYMPFKFAEVLDEVNNLMSPLAANKGLKLSAEYFGERELQVMGDPTRVIQILTNLVSNAIKFTDSGAVNIEIKSINYKSIVTSKITVEDSGIGIAKDNLSKIFDPFTQAELSTTREYGGTGLGLSIVNKLVEQMEGILTIKSIVDSGTKFTITLKHVLHESQIAMDENEIESLDLSGKTILVVDDNLINIEIASAMLSQKGAVTHSACDGAEAIDFLHGHQVDLVLLDIAMPVMDGCECIIAIRKIDKFAKLPVIALTANVMSSEVEYYMSIGFDAYLAKPYVRKSLIDTVNKHVNRGCE